MTLASSVAETEGNRISGAPAYWLFVPGIAASVFFLFKAVPSRTNGYRTGAGLVLLMLVLGFVGPIARALGHRVAASVYGFVVLCCYWTVTFFILFALASATPLAILYFWFFTLPPVVTSVAATISFANRVSSRWAISGVVVGFVCGVLVASIVIGTKRSFSTSAMDTRVRACQVSWEHRLTSENCWETRSLTRTDSHANL